MEKKKKKIAVRDVDANLWIDFKTAVAKYSLKTGKKIKLSEALEEALKDYIKKINKKLE